MRQTDSGRDPEIQRIVRNRQIMTVSSAIVSFGGVALAIVHKELAIHGLVTALVASGMVDVKTLIGIIRK